MKSVVALAAPDFGAMQIFDNYVFKAEDTLVLLGFN